MGNFLETPRFPDDLGVWALGGVGYNTVITGSTSGREQRNSLWSFARGQWDLQNCFRTNGGAADPYSIQTLRSFFRVCKGQAHGFRFRDWTDYLDEGGGILGPQLTSYSQPPTPTGNGNGTPTLQMYKRYSAPPLIDYRLIAKPLATHTASNGAAAITTIYRNGVACAQGSGAGQVSLDTTTGLVTFGADAAVAPTAWTTGYSTSFTVPAVPSGWAVGTVVYPTGVAGSISGFNGLPFPISAISGNTITIPALSLDGTFTGGTVSSYPQASDVLTWTGAFDTPCRFATDRFAPQLDVGTGALFGFQTLQIIEIRT